MRRCRKFSTSSKELQRPQASRQERKHFLSQTWETKSEKSLHRGKVLQTHLQKFYKDLYSDKKNKSKHDKDNDARCDSADDENKQWKRWPRQTHTRIHHGRIGDCDGQSQKKKQGGRQQRIKAEDLKRADEETTKMILEFFNFIIKKGSMTPSAWKKGDDQSDLQKKGDPTKPENYRPICTLPMIFKFYSPRCSTTDVTTSSTVTNFLTKVGFESISTRQTILWRADSLFKKQNTVNRPVGGSCGLSESTCFDTTWCDLEISQQPR